MSKKSALSTLGSAKARQVARLLELVPILIAGSRGRAAIVTELAERLAAIGLEDALPAIASGEDPTSTINRDWRILRDLGLLESLPGYGYKTIPGPRLPLWVTPAEAQSLEGARHALVQLGMPDASLIDGLLARISSRIRREAPRWSLAPSLRDIQPEVWGALQDALARGRRLRITYRYPDRPETDVRLLDRGRLAWMTGGFYLCAVRPDLADGQTPTFEHVREYRVDRMVAVEVLEEAVSCAELPTLDVVFRLSPELAGRVHDMVDGEGRRVQSTRHLPDGSLQVTVHEVSELRARQRLLAFGRYLLAVEAPDTLAWKLREEVATLAANLGHATRLHAADPNVG